MVKVSCIVPIYNVEAYLPACLDSLVNQDCNDFEVILVNDGSNDKSLQIANDYAAKYSVFTVVSKVNGGLSDARNYGMKYARGEYICFVDSDDWVATNYISALLTKASETNCGCVICDMEYKYDDGSSYFSSGGDVLDGNVNMHPQLITINNSACNKLFKKEIVEAFEFPFGMAYEDLATIPVSLALSKTIAKVEQPLYFYRQRSGSIAHSANMKIFDIYKAIKRCIDYFNDHNMKQYVPLMQSMYVVHGLDLTTLRIKDFDDTSLLPSYWKKNIECMNQYYPNYKQDEKYKVYSFKKKLIFKLLESKQYQLVKKLYGKN